MQTITPELLIPICNEQFAEKELEDGIIDNIADISANCMWGDVKRVERQFSLSGGRKRIRADIMVWHTDGTGTLIEVKTLKHNRNSDLAAIGQLMFYAIVAESRFGLMPRLVIAAPEIDRELYSAVQRFKVPISFLMIDGNRCIYLGKDFNI